MIRQVTLAVAMMALTGMNAWSEPRMIFRNGMASCGTWLQRRQSKQEAILASWIVGYLSGLNMESSGPDAIVGTDYDSLMGWIDNYCRANPLHPIAQAATALMGELRSRLKPGR